MGDAVRKMAAAQLDRNLSDEQAAEIVASDVGSFLMRDDKPRGGFDLILADPPYAIDEGELGSVLSSLGAGGLSGDSWRVVLTRPKRASTPVIPLHWVPARRLSYGDTLVFIFREA